MSARLLAAALAATLLPLAGRAADAENPYKNAKVGDFAAYAMTMKVADQNLTGTITSTVTAKTEKEVTIKVVGKVNGMDIPTQEQKIDLTKPFDPAKMSNLPGGADVKTEKLKEGKEKVEVAGKKYDCDWTTYKVKGKAGGFDIDADVKVWMSKAIPSGMAKMEMTTAVAGMKMEMTMELSETGNKK
jgi:hypothetical protein